MREGELWKKKRVVSPHEHTITIANEVCILMLNICRILLNKKCNKDFFFLFFCGCFTLISKHLFLLSPWARHSTDLACLNVLTLWLVMYSSAPITKCGGHFCVPFLQENPVNTNGSALVLEEKMTQNYLDLAKLNQWSKIQLQVCVLTRKQCYSIHKS